jgi:putative transposase
VLIAETFNREPPSESKSLDGQARKPKPQEMGRQVPQCVHTEETQGSVARQLRRHLGWVFHTLCAAQGNPDRRGACDTRSCAHADCDTAEIRSVSSVGVHKGKSAISLARVYGENKKSFAGQSFWARGYFVPTVGWGVQMIQDYIRQHEGEEARLEQLGLRR